MKNIIKKIAATAMAFALLGAGTAATTTITPQFDNSITASAACNHVVGSTSWSKWVDNGTKIVGIIPLTRREYEKRTCKCVKCGKVIETQKRYRDHNFWGTNSWYDNYVYYS